MASAPAVSALLRAYRPELSLEAEKTAFVVHLTFLASGFELVASGDRADADASGGPPSGEPIQGWNQVPGEYAFLYAYPKLPGTSTSQQAYLKCLSVGDVMMVDACSKDQGLAAAGAAARGTASGEVAAGASTTVLHTELRMSDFVRAAAGGVGEEKRAGTYSVDDMYKNLEGLVNTVATDICLPLLAGHREASDEGAGGSARAQGQASSTAPSTGTGSGSEAPSRPPPDRTIPQDTEGIAYPPIPGRPGFGDDLGPGGGAGILPDAGPRFPGSGMLVGPEDPRWGLMRPGGLEDPDDLYGTQGPGGLPRGVPPGARFDPFGPPGVPGFEPGRFGDDGGRRGPRGGLHRDLEPFL